MAGFALPCHIGQTRQGSRTYLRSSRLLRYSLLFHVFIFIYFILIEKERGREREREEERKKEGQ